MKDFITRKMDAQFAHQLKTIEHELRSLPHPKQPSIVISREFGCEGYPLARKLAERLTGEVTWEVYGRDTIKEMAKEGEYSDALMEALPDEPRSAIRQYLDELLAHRPTDYAIYKRMAQNVKILTMRGASIIVGAAASVITYDQKNTLRLRLIGSQDFRLQRVIDMGYAKENAMSMLRERDQNRVDFVREFTGKDIRDPHLYHLILNNSKLSLDTMTEMVLTALKTVTP